MRYNKFIVFTGPSGVGKATIEKELFKDKSLKLCLSCSATTRSPREKEVDGIHYHFFSPEKFDKLIEQNEFIEWNEHFSNKYGTLKSEIKKIQNNNRIPFLELEVNGAKNITEHFGEDKIISIFLAPPSIEELKKRIKERGTETNKQIAQRLARVQKELDEKDSFQHIVINDSVENAVEKIRKIIRGSI